MLFRIILIYSSFTKLDINYHFSQIYYRTPSSQHFFLESNSKWARDTFFKASTATTLGMKRMATETKRTQDMLHNSNIQISQKQAVQCGEVENQPLNILNTRYPKHPASYCEHNGG